MAILFISNSNFSSGLSGGDRIFLELLRRWSKHESVDLMGAYETEQLLRLYNLKHTKLHLTSPKTKHTYPNSINIIWLQIKRTIRSSVYICSHLNTIKKYSLIYSVSDFYADFFPALLIKILNPKTIWIAGYYLFSPIPTDPSSPYRKTKQPIKGIIYYLAQKITIFFTKHFADYVFVTSKPDVKRFINKRLSAKKIIVIRGGVDVSKSSTYLKKHTLPSLSNRKYSACFIGRLHPQKGILELIDIWKEVIKYLPKAKLAVIGNGQLESEVKQKILDKKLSKNIDLLGFLDGHKKEAIFRNSCLVVHPAIYDSGGMASAEAMSWGLPAISFDLEALKSYYPQGMIKIPCYDLEKFAKTIVNLLKNKRLYHQTSLQARQLILNHWNWDNQAKKIYRNLNL